MDQQQSERAGAGDPAGLEAGWVDKRIAGGAEAAAAADVEGLDGLS